MSIMWPYLCLIFLILPKSLVANVNATYSSNNELLGNFLAGINHQLAMLYDKDVLANLQNELHGPNDLIALLQSEIATRQIIAYLKTLTPKIAKYKRLGLGDELQRRQLSRIPELGYEALGPEDVQLLYAVTSNMSDNYSHVRLCRYKEPTKCDLKLIPDVQNILHESKNLEEIEYYWFEWRRRTGASARMDFVRFIELYKKTAKLNDFKKAEDYWFRNLGMSSKVSLNLLDRFMTKLRPIFLQFHAHARGSLRKQYGEQVVPLNKPYPQHLAEVFLGNAYRRVDAKWFVDYPYPELGIPNITDRLDEVGLSTMQRIYWNVAEFFRTMGYPMQESSLWEHAKIKASHNPDHCWHKPWQFYDNKQINLTYCPLIDEERFFNMFEALSDVYYYQAYKNQPTVLREEPLPNFSDGLGKFHTLAASSPTYLSKLGLLNKESKTKMTRLNRLYLQGLRVIFLLPVFYVLERYRVDVLDGSINALDNEAYWRLTEYYTGAGPPSPRTNADFDVPAKLLMEVDDEYTSQILSIVLQFQLYHYFCKHTSQYIPGDPARPLDLCDLSDQQVVGERLYAAMQLGAASNYKQVLQTMIEEDEFNIDGLLAYFEPLREWLIEQNHARGLEVGWN